VRISGFLGIFCRVPPECGHWLNVFFYVEHQAVRLQGSHL